MITTYKRHKQQFILVKVSVKLYELYEVPEYNKLMNSITAFFREYDMIYYNYVGELLVISENITGIEVIKKRPFNLGI